MIAGRGLLAFGPAWLATVRGFQRLDPGPTLATSKSVVVPETSLPTASSGGRSGDVLGGMK